MLRSEFLQKIHAAADSYSPRLFGDSSDRLTSAIADAGLQNTPKVAEAVDYARTYFSGDGLCNASRVLVFLILIEEALETYPT